MVWNHREKLVEKWNTRAESKLPVDFAEIKKELAEIYEASETTAVNYTSFPKQIKDLLKKLGSLESKSQWISVGERLPEPYKAYLVNHIFRGVEIAFRNERFFRGEQGDEDDSAWTHWQELPEGPK